MRHIAWLDDEIETLKPLITLLEQTGDYKVYAFSNPKEFIDFLKDRRQYIEAIILDEHIGFESGLEIYDQLREELGVNIPVIFVTQEENADYIKELIARGVQHYISKPVKFSNLLAAVTQIVEGNVLREAHRVTKIPKQFRKVYSLMESANSVSEWRAVLGELVKSEALIGQDLFNDLYDSAQAQFFKFFVNQYKTFVEARDSLLVVTFLDRYSEFLEHNTLVIVVDNFSLWIWEMIKNDVNLPKEWEIYKDEFLISLLPSVTQYSRQSLLSGFFPIEMREMGLWIDELDDGVKTKYEPELIKLGFQKKGLPQPEIIYFTGENSYALLKVAKGTIILIVPSFDQFVHITTDHKSLKAMFLNLTDFAEVVRISFTRGIISKILSEATNRFRYIMICSDHGSTFVNKPVYVLGRHFMPLNPRYKYGEDFRVESDDFVAFFKDPIALKLPIPKHFKVYFAGKDRFFVRKQGNYKGVIAKFKGSLQHGGISLEEIFIPVVVLRKKNLEPWKCLK
ncbi:MAG: bifunctional response regulator/alkaline phosphatase family protein [Chlorobi bacterium]|nr:bifunctional response regulator/alkaline phosphatase family protein [Chlorobiota bacterium]